MFRIAAILCLIGVLYGCSTSGNNQTTQNDPQTRQVQGQLSLPSQILPPPNIRSIELFRNSPGQAPIIELGSSDRLTLRFDELSRSSGLFRISVTHHNADWTESSLVPNLFMQGFMEDYLHVGKAGRFQNPSWFAYSYTFPNSNMRVSRSGNFQLHVHNQETNEHLFSMPFLVYEESGEVSSSMEELYNLDSRYTRHHQLFARYFYDSASTISQSDISIYFVQNQFWSTARKADQEDFSEAGVARMYLSRDNAFVGTFEFLDLNLSSIDQYSMQIVDFSSGDGSRIPRITLNRDVVNLSLSPRLRQLNRLSSPSTREDAKYALVRFQLDIPLNERTNDPIFIVGGFNNWGLNPANRLRYDASTGLYTGEVVVKEGRYSYKYVTVANHQVNSLRFDASFASTRQEYHTLVYLLDETFRVDRLVAVQRFQSDF
ncbi:MAG: DUF5103 domain-containing protein [Balneolales bacterium]|nr:DUF5103 domain-containing protein [Balneolales bacterium]